ncbi:LysR family transcriptional regulator (plasmid) [Pseudomonas silvicola]|nr:LysR family transcriptional regulator [Pseudomonas silvicola]
MKELASGSLVRADDSSWDMSLAIRLYRQPILQNSQAEQLWLRACASETANAA